MMDLSEYPTKRKCHKIAFRSLRLTKTLRFMSFKISVLLLGLWRTLWGGRIDEMFRKVNIIMSSGITWLRLYLSFHRDIFALWSRFKPCTYSMLKTFWHLLHLCPYRQKAKWRYEGEKQAFPESSIQDSLLQHAESLKGFVCKRFS